MLATIALAAATSVPAAPPVEPEPPGIFARATADEPLERLTFLVPGVTFHGWQPVRPVHPHRQPASGAGLEVSLARWISGGTYVGAVVHGEKLDRFRGGIGVEAGYQLVGIELGLARELPVRDGPRGQWSLEVGPYASIGMLYVMPRWVFALDRRGARDTPGDGVMLVVGLKLPIKIGGR
ncbi:MAG: hypothetical protein HYV09_30385 [Deltaproteobacteria bacterium]|nr:hypothetical protein [Deltaproteobacteria bacterium]